VDYKTEVLKLAKIMRTDSLDGESIYLRAKYGPSKSVKVPLRMTEELVCLVGMIIGDGHLKKNQFTTTIEISNKRTLEILSQIIFQLFDIKTTVIPVRKRDGRLQTYHLTVYSKAVQELLSQVFEIPKGKKSNIVDVPKNVTIQEKSIQNAFIIGLLITEGSRKDRKRVRLASSSERLLRNTQKMLTNLNIQSYVTKWTYKKYKREFYELSFKKVYLDNLSERCKSEKVCQILKVFADHLKENDNPLGSE